MSIWHLQPEYGLAAVDQAGVHFFKERTTKQVTRTQLQRASLPVDSTLL